MSKDGKCTIRDTSQKKKKKKKKKKKSNEMIAPARYTNIKKQTWKAGTTTTHGTEGRNMLAIPFIPFQRDDQLASLHGQR